MERKDCSPSRPLISRRFVVLTIYRIQSWRVNRESHPASEISRLRPDVQLEYLLESPSPSAISEMMLRIVTYRPRVFRCRWRLKITVSTAKPGEKCRHHRVLFQSIVLRTTWSYSVQSKSPGHICQDRSLDMVSEGQKLKLYPSLAQCAST